MKRPLFVIGVVFFITTWLAFLFSASTALLLSAAAVFSALLCFLFRGRWRYGISACLAFFCVAAALGSYSLYVSRNLTPVRRLAGISVTVEGVITSVKYYPNSTSYTLKASFPGQAGLPKTVPLVIRSIGELEQSEGDVIRCKVYLNAAPDTNWYKSRGISVTGQKARNIETIPAGRYRFDRALILFRNRLAQNVYAKLPEENAAVVAAMVLGLKDDVSPETYTAVNRSGTSHLLSVSGLHLAVFAAFALGLLKLLRCPRRVSAVIAIVLCFLFSFLVGFGESVFRSFVMTALTLGGRVFKRRGDSRSSLGFALLICSVLWPNWALSRSLWLSAGSTLGIILYSGRISKFLFEKLKRGRPLADRFLKTVFGGAAVSIGAYAFTVPILFALSGWISLVSPLANILVAPFVPVVIIGGAFCALVPGTALPVQIASSVTNLCTSAVLRISALLGRLPFAIIALDESWLLLWIMIASTFLILFIVLRADKKLVSYGLALLLFCFCAGDLSLTAARKNTAELITLENCDTALLLCGREAVVLGTPNQYDITVLLRYMQFRGVRAVSALIASDCGDTISSGLTRLADSYPVDCVVGPNDAYILGQLETGLKNSLVYSGGYAETTVFGGIFIETPILSDEIAITAQNTRLVKYNQNCDIMKSYGGKEIEIYKDDILRLPKRTRPAFEPVGGALFGESRVYLRLEE